MFGQIPYGISNPLLASSAAKTSIFSKINWGSLLSNTQKTLSVVNQAIPLYYQVKPIFSNFKMLGRISKELGNIGNNNINSNISKNDNVEQPNTYNNTPSFPEPTFFL